MKRKLLLKNILGVISLLVFTAIVSIIILQLPSAYISNGIWQGNFDINGKGKHDFTALYMNGKVVAISRSANVIYQGKVSIKDQKYSSVMDMYIMNKGLFDSVQLTGTMLDPTTIHTRYTTDNGQNEGQLELSYKKKLFEHPTSLEKADGEWILYDVPNILKVKIKDGIIRGADTSGCAYEGKINTIDDRYNVYEIHMIVASCHDRNMDMTGMAYLSSVLKDNDTFNIHLFNNSDDWSMYIPIVRNDDTRLIDKNKTWGGPPGPAL